MSIAAGARFGPYEILSALGAGGMGEVYRARDTRLHRDVAIKVLPEVFAADPERLARFEQEARAAAALNHPHILAVHDLGTHDGAPYIVSELLEGETLRERLAQGPLPLRKAVEYAVQLAHGLAAAHERGIVHRDLKPENVFVTSDGRVKILDFGLAKLTEVEAASGHLSLLATGVRATQPGLVLGTVGYMSPEQVRGQAADHRSDLFSFGAILYEMLSGQRAFHGPSGIETLNAILNVDPPNLAQGSAALPPALDRLVRRCLEKSAAERFQSARDVGFALEALSGSAIETAPQRSAVPSRRVALAIVMAALVVAAAVAGLFVGRTLSRVSPPEQVIFDTKTFEPQMIFNGRFMPDGQTIVFSAALEGNEPELFVSRPGAVAPQPLGVRRTHLLSVSSNGELAVLTDAVFLGHRIFRGTLARMPIDGAPKSWLENVREADWSPDGSTLAVIRDRGQSDSLEYPIGTTLYEGRPSGYLSDVRVSPDGSRVAFMEHPLRFDDRGTVKVVDRSGSVRTLGGEYWGEEGMAWTPDSSTVVYSGGDAGSEAYQPRAVLVAGGRPSHMVLPSPGAVFMMDIAHDGRWLVTRNDDVRSIRALLPHASSEREFPWLNATGGLPVLSADARMLVFTDQSQSAGNNYAVRMRKTDGSAPIRLGEGYSVAPSPDGTRVLAGLFNPDRAVIYPIGPGETIHLPVGRLERAVPRGWFRDGTRVILCGNEPSRPLRCYQQDVAGGLPMPLAPEGFDVGQLSRVGADSGSLVLIASDGTKHILTLSDGKMQRVAGVRPDEDVLGWTADGKALFVQRQSAIPVRIDRVNPSTGARQLVREIDPSDRAGMLRISTVSLADDGHAYAYLYWRRVARMFVVRGLGPLENQ